jgi:hypothetical protein
MAFGGIVVVLLCMGLLGVLVSGVVLMGVGGKKNEKLGNKLMIARIWLQALILITLSLMFMSGGK